MSNLALAFNGDDGSRSERLELRPLQSATLDMVRKAWIAGATNVLVQAPCGFGKTELATAMLQAVHENEKKGSFLCDRVQLVQQTSQRFDKYGLPHGIVQADNPRFRPDEPIQVCSVATLASRGREVGTNLLFVDECHIMDRRTKALLKERRCRAIGLTATPFTKGLGIYFDALVNATTTNHLIREGWLTPFRVFAAKGPDLTGVKVMPKSGEWDEREVERRVLPIVGDCVAEYVRLGEGRKFICFAATKAHAAELMRRFADAGIVTRLYTDEQHDEERKLTVDEFRKPDSFIRGLISVEALTRGFDVEDVSCLIITRPLRRAFHVHVQMLGRILRIADGKTDAIVLDHTPNTKTFWGQLQEYMEYGATELDDGKKKPKKATKKERKPVECSKCHHIHSPAPACPSCGNEYARRSGIHHLPGELTEFAGNDPGASVEDMQSLYSQLLWIGDQNRNLEGAAAYRFKERTGRWPPRSLSKVREVATPELERWVMSRKIAFIKAQKKNGKKRP
jgi:superfamily II DNA or RNA helicase